MTVFVAVSRFSPDQVTYALRTIGDPLRFVERVPEIVREADSRIPLTKVVTQAAEIDGTISRVVAFAKLCTGFPLLALLIARPGAVVWMVLRRGLLLAAVGLPISLPAALIASRLGKSFLFETSPNDPGNLALSPVVLLSAMVLAGYVPARRASRIDPLAALRHD